MTTKCQYIFMGTPSFAVTVLDAFSKVFGPPLLAVTQPDKPAGRKAVITPSEVKRYARERGIGVITPERLSDDQVAEQIRNLRPEVIVTAAFGKILPLSILALPERGCLNVHASLLPRHRGASPVAAAILAGDRETGVTIMQMDQGLDTGPILKQTSLVIAAEDTTGSLTARLAELAGPVLADTVQGLRAGTVREQPQDNEAATLTRILTKRDGALDFSRSAAELERRVRAMMPWPRSYCRLGDSVIHVERAVCADPVRSGPEPGTIVGLDGGIDIACREGVLRLLEIVPAGRKRMQASAMAHNLNPGDRFDSGFVSR